MWQGKFGGGLEGQAGVRFEMLGDRAHPMSLVRRVTK